MRKARNTSPQAVRVLRLGLVADPGVPSDIARALVKRKLPRLLTSRVSRQVRWEVQLVQEALPLDEHRTLPLLEVAAERKPAAGWDTLVYLTDLPRSAGSEPVVAELSAKDGTALISLPSVGGVRLRRHVTETLLYLVGRMYQARYADHDSGEPDRPEGSDAGAVAASRSGRLLRRSSERVSPLREKPSSQEGTDTTLVLTGLRGRARLLFGMVRDNRPWRLVPHLATATAAAAGTAAFGIFYSSIWAMADVLSPARLSLITALAIAVMVAWLLFYNRLWDPVSDHRTIKEALLYNLSTLATLVLGVACMYALLYVLALLAAFVVIDSGYLRSQLGHPVGPGSYAILVWLACSMGMVAGALGSSLDSEDAVRQATYSRREQQRQKRNRDRPPQEESSGRYTAD